MKNTTTKTAANTTKTATTIEELRNNIRDGYTGSFEEMKHLRNTLAAFGVTCLTHLPLECLDEFQTRYYAGKPAGGVRLLQPVYRQSVTPEFIVESFTIQGDRVILDMKLKSTAQLTPEMALAALLAGDTFRAVAESVPPVVNRRKAAIPATAVKPGMKARAVVSNFNYQDHILPLNAVQVL